MSSYVGNNPRSTLALREWHAHALPEAALEPQWPIVDAHHHLYGQPGDERWWRMPDLVEDFGSSGHRLIGTVYVEGYASGWRTGGPESLWPVGEVEMIVGQTRAPQTLPHGPCRVAAGIVASADLLLGDDVAPVLEAHLDASDGRLRGVRFHTAWDGGTVGSKHARATPPGLLADATVRRGIAQLQRFGLSFDAWVYHPQIAEVTALADAFPNQTIVLDHVGGLIGVAEHRRGHAAALARWTQALRALGERPNVFVKIGGMGMPVFGFGFEHEARPATSSELARAWQALIDACIEAFTPARCLFETNFPVDKQSAGTTQTWNAYKLATRHLTGDERRDLFYRTACRAYRLPELLAIGDAL